MIRQAAKVCDMNKDLLRTGDKGHVKFRFMYRPEYLKPGTTILFREGRTKGLGVVTQVVPSHSVAESSKSHHHGGQGSKHYKVPKETQ